VIEKIAYRARRKWRDVTTIRRPLGAGPAGQEKISLVLYFDYEREFGNIAAKDSSETGFNAIIDILNKNAIRTTWNCVGKISESYSKTISQIISNGHEIACHTYNHIEPLSTDYEKLFNDIGQFKTTFKNKYKVDVQGFHSPSDGWSKQLIEILSKHGFRYDIAVENKDQNHNACYLITTDGYLSKNTHSILRIPSVSDDWMMISKHLEPEKMLSHWQSFLTEKYYGKTIAVGFHPWVIGKNKGRIDIFEHFIHSLQNFKDLQLFTGSEITKWYQE